MSIPSNLTLRPVTSEDYSSLEKFCESVQFHCGVHNLKLYHQTAPKGWQIIVENENEEIVAFHSLNKMENGIIYGFDMIVRSDYQGLKLTKHFEDGRFWETKAAIGSLTHFAITRFSMKIWLGKRLGFVGKVNLDSIPNCALPYPILQAVENHFPALAAYDKTILKYDRSEFLKKWTLDPKYSKTIAVWNGSECVGYGTLRDCGEYKSISPLYADSNQIAFALFCELAKGTQNGDLLDIPALADKRAALRFATVMNLELADTEIRYCSRPALGYVQSLLTAKVFAVHDFWPL